MADIRRVLLDGYPTEMTREGDTLVDKQGSRHNHQHTLIL